MTCPNCHQAHNPNQECQNNFLYSNAFVQQNNPTWNQHFHDMYRQQQFQEAVQDPDSTYYDHFIPFGAVSGQTDVATKPTNFFIKKTTSVVPVSSKDRDFTQFKSPNHFIFDLPKTFHNIEKVELVACSFPNAANVIKGSDDGSLQNNRIFWRNYSDVFSCFYNGISGLPTISFVVGSLNGQAGYYFDIEQYYCSIPKLDVYIYNTETSLNGKRSAYLMTQNIDNVCTFFVYFEDVGDSFVGCVNMPAPVYHVDILPGNYTVNGLISQIQSQMNQVLRTDGQYHYFNVGQSNDTNLITFKSYNLTKLDSNPLATQLGSYEIVVTQPGHTFLTGDTVLIVNAQSFNGLSSTLLNNEFTITNIIDINSFTITVNQFPSATSAGGGNNIFTGVVYSFQFIFGTNNRYLDGVFSKSIADNLGFNIENSGTLLSQSDPFSTVSLQLSSAIVSPANVNWTRFYLTNSIDTSIPLKSITMPVTNITNNVITFIPNASFPIENEKSIYFYLENVVYINSLGKEEVADHLEMFLNVLPTSLTTLLALKANIVSASSGVIKLGTLVKFSKVDMSPDITFKGIQNSNMFFLEGIGSNYIDVFYNFTFAAADLSASTVYTSFLKVTHPNHGFRFVNVAINRSVYTVTNSVFDTIPSYSCLSTPSTNDTTSVEITLVSGTHSFTIGSFERVYFINTGSGHGASQLAATMYLAHIDSNNSFVITVPDNTLVGSGACTAYFTSQPISLSQFNTTNNAYAIDSSYTDYASTSSTLTVTNPKKFPSNIVPNTGTGTAFFNTKQNEVFYYRITSSSSSIFGVPLSTLNNTCFDVETIIDANTYYIELDKYFFETENNVSFGGSSVFVNSDLHGWRYSQSNTNDWSLNSSLQKGIRLSGDDRVYLTCTGLPTVYKKEILDGFAEIILDQQPGAICFNSFVTEPFIFQNLKDKLSSLEFKVVYDSGDYYNFNNLEFSFTLKITEIQNVLENETQTGLTNKDIYSVR